MNLKEIDTLPVIIVAMLSVLAYYIFSKDKALEKKLQALEKELEDFTGERMQKFIDETEKQRDKLGNTAKRKQWN